MDLNRLRSLLAAPLAALFLVLVLCVFPVQRSPSVGIRIPLLRVRTVAFKECDFLSDRSVVVRLHKDGSTWINETQESHEKLGIVLAEIYDNREEKIIYMLPDPDVSFGDFAEIYSKVGSSTKDLRIMLSTRQLDKEIQQCPPGRYCELDWQGSTYIPCVRANVPVYLPLHTPLIKRD
jgi:biopolymer transport protein ExbD